MEICPLSSQNAVISNGKDSWFSITPLTVEGRNVRETDWQASPWPRSTKRLKASRSSTLSSELLGE